MIPPGNIQRSLVYEPLHDEVMALAEARSLLGIASQFAHPDGFTAGNSAKQCLGTSCAKLGFRQTQSGCREVIPCQTLVT